MAPEEEALEDGTDAAAGENTEDGAETAVEESADEVAEAATDDGAEDGAGDEAGDGEGTPVDPETWNRYLRITEALLFASTEPMTERMLANRLPEDADVKGLLKALQLMYAERGVNLVRAGASWAFRTSQDLTDYLNKEVEVARKLSRAAIETLAIIAYHQPCTRAEIEEIRGVSISKGTIDVLMEEEWIRPRGRRQTPGRPLQWGTTDSFLDHFGLETLRDLPGKDELKAAGLLDASPAINAYRATAELFNTDQTEEGEGEDADGDEEDALPEDALSAVREEPDEPLDPEDGY
ncbi:MAG: SMC-Scp complex subunit ScpB [Rhodospirillales bacterium]|nr:SMC-Scp complex subunit ScpB [Rhodospirillales bacterium]